VPRPTLTLTLQSGAGVGILGCIALVGLGWLLVGLPLSMPRGLAALESTRWPSFAAGSADLTPVVASSPGLLFATASGPTPTHEVTVALQGIAKGPHDQAALLKIGDAPPAWLGVGQSRDGVTLISIGANQVVLDTALGFREVTFDKPNLPRPLIGART